MDDAAAPVGKSATRVAASAPPVVQAAAPVAVSRAKGRPVGKRKAVKVMAELLPAPTGAQVYAARIAAGQSQTEAANVVGANRPATWSYYEGSITPMPALAWTWYLLATGQHPAMGLKKKRT